MKKCNAGFWSPSLSNRKILAGLFLAQLAIVPAFAGGLYKPTQMNVTSKTSLEQLQAGRKIYINRCASCHNLIEPERYDTTQWTKWVNRMAPKARINAEEKALILKYLTKGKK